MAKYYVLDGVRDQVLEKGRLGFASVSGSFPLDWHYCPCVIENQCTSRNNICQIKVGIFFNDPHIKLTLLDIFFIGNKKSGFIRVNDMKINQLIENKLINKSSLEIVSF